MKPDRSYRDYDLLTVIATGDGKAFSILFEGLKNKVYRCAFHVSQAGAAAEQITTEVFLTVWLNKTSLPGMADIDAEICNITSNACLSHLKKIAQEKKRSVMLTWNRNGDIGNKAMIPCEEKEMFEMHVAAGADEAIKKNLNLAWNLGSAPPAINEKCAKKILVAVLSHSETRFVPLGRKFLKKKFLRFTASVLIMAISAFIPACLKYLPALQEKQHFTHSAKKVVPGPVSLTR